MHLVRALLLLLGLATPALAWPDRPITIVYPYAPGSDAAARALAEALQQDLGQPVAVVNRDGASGVIGMRAVAQAAPDGYMLGMTPMTPLVVQPHAVRNLGIGPASFEPICNVTDNILGLVVRADSPFADVPALVAAAQRRQLSFGSPGPNSIPQLAVARLQAAAGGDYLHVPFRGSAVSVTEVLAGRLDFATTVAATAGPLVRNGQLRLIGVFSEQRHPEFPDVPTMREQGIEAVQPSYASLYAPRGTPEPILARLEAACERALRTDGFRRAAAQTGAVSDYRDRAALRSLLDAQYASFGALLRSLGVVAE
jgi:tripartite-type tricarboxylate transporter receptor subunit TctC